MRCVAMISFSFFFIFLFSFHDNVSEKNVIAVMILHAMWQRIASERRSRLRSGRSMIPKRKSFCLITIVANKPCVQKDSSQETIISLMGMLVRMRNDTHSVSVKPSY